MRILQCSNFLFFVSLIFAQQPATAPESPFEAVPEKAVSDALTFAAPVPDFEARDIIGRTWRSADLRGKLTVVQLWGSYCIPCIKEHPPLQDFFNEARSKNNVQVLTFNVDRNPSRALSYMKKEGYTFPVIVDRDLELRLFPE